MAFIQGHHYPPWRDCSPDEQSLSDTRMALFQSANQEKHFEGMSQSSTIKKQVASRPFLESSSKSNCSVGTKRVPPGKFTPGRRLMSGQVVLYFEDQADALRFALVAGSVMAGDGSHTTADLAKNAARVTRIRLNATNTGKAKQASPPERAA